MSDKNKEEEIEQSAIKGKRGFRKGLSGNPNGRPKGAKSAVMSDKDFEKAIMQREGVILERMLKIIREGSDNDALKAGIKWMEWSIKLRENGGIVISKTEKDGSKSEYEVEEEQDQKANGTTGKVVNFRKLVSTEYKEKDSDSKEKKSEEDSE